ncbi:MAG: protein-glutamate O-methyltransferase CheR [Burkholderiaceae bacterium]
MYRVGRPVLGTDGASAADLVAHGGRDGAAGPGERDEADDCGESDAGAIAGIVDEMRVRTGIEFGHYRPATLERRIRNRMILAGVASLPDYLERLRADGGEAASLLERLTIKVSRFYRNAYTFDQLSKLAIPRLAADAGGPLRLWCAGCGRGEEAYTLAMLLHEAGVDGSVLATDIDGCALAEARQGRYPEGALIELPGRLRERYLRPVDGGGRRCYEVDEALRARVRFAVHDLLAGMPPCPAAFHLVSCRNVVIYFAPSAQRRAFDTLQQALAPGAFMCLGEAEWPDAELASVLRAVGCKTRVFRFEGSA